MSNKPTTAPVLPAEIKQPRAYQLAERALITALTEEIGRQETINTELRTALAASQQRVAELERELIHHAELYNALDEDFGEQCKEIDELTEEMIQLQASSQSVWEQAIAIIGSTFQGSSCRTMDVIAALQAARDAQQEGKEL